MQRPYTVRLMAERAGTGDHPAPPPAQPTCAACGTAIDTGRVYCGSVVCQRRWATTGRSTREKVEADPTIAKYSW